MKKKCSDWIFCTFLFLFLIGFGIVVNKERDEGRGINNSSEHCPLKWFYAEEHNFSEYFIILQDFATKSPELYMQLTKYLNNFPSLQIISLSLETSGSDVY